MNCSATTKTGKRCSAPALRGADRCFHHAESVADERRAARALGGHASKAKVLPDQGGAPVRLVSGADVEGLLTNCVDHVLHGRIDPRVANAVGYLVGVLLKAKEHGAVLETVERIERLVNSRRVTLLDGGDLS